MAGVNASCGPPAPNDLDVAALLAEQSWLRSLARHLVGGSDADDLAQDVVVATLRQQPAQREGLRPWLARVARRLASQRRRGDARRARRERAVVHDRTEPSAADVVARAQLHRVVVEAVLQLDEPYRTTVLLRCYDGLSPADIALRCGVPTETARTRLRRGLASLRARLDRQCGDRGAWATPLGALLGGGQATTTIAGGAVVSTNGKVTAGAFAVVVLASLGWYVARDSTTEPATSPTPPPIAQAAPRGETAGTGAVVAPVPDAAARAVERNAAPVAHALRVLGRSVAAESGLPVAPAHVDLFLSPIAESVMGARAPDASTTTADDGRFCIELALPEPRHVTLRVHAPQRAAVSRQWARVDAGDLDCGDVPLALGAALIARVVDEHAAPADGVRLAFHLQQAGAAPWRAASVYAASGADGSVPTTAVLAPGTWQIACNSQHRLLRAARVDVPVGGGTVTVEVVVRRSEDLPSIRGVVVDDGGTPVRDLVLYARRSVGADLRCTTAADGTFRFVRTEGPDEPVQLRLYGRHRLRDAEARHAWGARDVQVHVLGPVPARLRVVDAAGRAVTRFAVRLQAVAGDRSSVLSAAQVRRQLHGDVLVVRDLPPDRYRVAILPEDAAAGACAPVEWQIERDVELRVALAVPADLRVALRLPDGAPVARSRVQLLRSEAGSELRLDCQAFALHETFAQRRPGQGDGVVVGEATSGADGIAMLRGVPGETLAVRALGPGHAPVLRTIALAPEGNELVLQVARGATVHGTLFPRATFDRLQPDAAAIRSLAGTAGDIGGWMASRAPSLQLVGAGGARDRLPPGDVFGLRVDPDGSFRFDGVPAGDWTLVLAYWRDVADGGGTRHRLEAAVARLADGEVRRVDVDVACTQPGRVRGLVTVAGQPWRDGRARLGTSDVRTDADGRFDVGIDAGRYWLEVLPADGGERLAVAGAPVDVVPDAVVEHTFDLRRRVLAVRVLETDGTPANDRLVLLRGGVQDDAPARDADGWIRIEPAPFRPVEVLTYPRGFDAAARAATPPQQRQQLVIRLGAVAVDGGREQTRVELRVPAGR
jgi:RNA polymerase sigma-70 factor (ECF subfamily)